MERIRTGSPFTALDQLGNLIGWFGVFAALGVSLCFADMAAEEFSRHAPLNRLMLPMFFAVQTACGAALAIWLSSAPKTSRGKDQLIASNSSHPPRNTLPEDGSARSVGP